MAKKYTAQVFLLWEDKYHILVQYVLRHPRKTASAMYSPVLKKRSVWSW